MKLRQWLSLLSTSIPSLHWVTFLGGYRVDRRKYTMLRYEDSFIVTRNVGCVVSVALHKDQYAGYFDHSICGHARAS